jgi:hypothetical protein
MQDEVEKPDHYQFGQMQAWDIIELALIGTHDPVTAYHKGVALAYLLRASRKGGDTDIAKASAHLKRETARHVTAAPDYDPASAAFWHGDMKISWWPAWADKQGYRYARSPDGSSHPHPVSAPEIAAADGAGDYGNPVTPGCAMPSADDRTHGVFDVDLTRPAFFHTTDGVYHAYARARWP